MAAIAGIAMRISLHLAADHGVVAAS